MSFRKILGLYVVAVPLFAVTVFAQASASVASQLDRAARLVEKQDWPQAEQILLSLLQHQPKQADALNLMGIVRSRQSRVEEAKRYFHSAAQANPALATAWLNLAKIYEGQGDSALALATLQDGAKFSPRDPHLCAESAVLLADKGDFTAAVGQLEKIPAQVRDADQWELLGRIYLSAGNLPKAEESLRQVLRTKPEWIPVLRQLAGIALKEGDNQKAGAYMLRAVRLAPSSPDLLYEYAQVCLQSGFSGEAVRTMRNALRLEPDRPEFLYLMGEALTETPDYHEALAYFKHYQELRPQDANGETSLGWSFYLEQNYDESRRHFEGALQLNPNQADAVYHLGMIAFELNDQPKALELLKRSIELMPNDARPRLGLGMLYLRSEDTYGLARKELENSVSLDPTEPKAHYQLSQAYTRLGETALAKKELDAFKAASKKSEEKVDRSLQTPPFAAPGDPKP